MRHRAGPTSELIPSRTSEHTYHAGFTVLIDDEEFYIEGASTLRFASPLGPEDLELTIQRFRKAYDKALNPDTAAQLRIGKYVLAGAEQSRLFRRLHADVIGGKYTGATLSIDFEVCWPINGAGASCAEVQYRPTPKSEPIKIDMSHAKYLGIFVQNYLPTFDKFNDAKLEVKYYDNTTEKVSARSCFSYSAAEAAGWSTSLDSGDWIMLPELLVTQLVAGLLDNCKYAVQDWASGCSEDDFIDKLCLEEGALKMHLDSVNIEGTTVEICDVLLSDRDLLFVKQGDGGIKLGWVSYVCQQAVQTADYMVMGNSALISKLNGKLKRSYVNRNNEQEFTFVVVLGYDVKKTDLKELSPNVIDCLSRAKEDITDAGFGFQIVLAKKK